MGVIIAQPLQSQLKFHKYTSLLFEENGFLSYSDDTLQLQWLLILEKALSMV